MVDYLYALSLRLYACFPNFFFSGDLELMTFLRFNFIFLTLRRVVHEIQYRCLTVSIFNLLQRIIFRIIRSTEHILQLAVSHLLYLNIIPLTPNWLIWFFEQFNFSIIKDHTLNNLILPLTGAISFQKFIEDIN